ncbi:uncharacterized protein LOC130623194 [Hydractinia symbiolongicarpus]|uniref:uncharacterized protein LOC130623194 n=1 Tax=Hydractinia symbiolongicarpus TaxID=13093 RepID=UPI00254A7DB1|nr:uncharacterized protein LOC130623194 [Hydractinia symbiolongicarpus]
MSINQEQDGGCVFFSAELDAHKTWYKFLLKSWYISVIFDVYAETDSNSQLTIKNIQFREIISYQTEKMEEKIDLMLQQINKIENRLGGIESTLTVMKELQSDVDTIKKNQCGIIEKQASHDTTINNHTEEITGLKFTCDNILSRNTKIETDISDLKKENKTKEGKINKLRAEINDLEQYGRRVMVDIRGIPRVQNEDTTLLTTQLAELMKVKIEKEDIDISHRTSNKKEASIIVKFNSRYKRNIFYEGRKKLSEKTIQDLGFQGSTKIYINESLTSVNGELFRQAREHLLSKKLVKYVWTKNGQVYVRETDTADIINIKSKDDIFKCASDLQ